MGAISQVIQQGRILLEKLDPVEDTLKEFQEGITEAKSLHIEKAISQFLTHDQFEVAYKVANADGQINSAEQKALDEIRVRESGIDIFSKNKPSDSKSVKSGLEELQGMVNNLKPTRVTKAQALRIAYDTASIDGETSSSEAKVIDSIIKKEPVKEIKNEVEAKTQTETIANQAQSIPEVLGVKAKLIKDPFAAALLMAIENDGILDKLEIDHLTRLEKETSRKAKPVNDKVFHRAYFSFRLDFNSPFEFSFITKPKRKKKQKTQFELNHNLREAFKVAALDGSVDTTEISNLKKLF